MNWVIPVSGLLFLGCLEILLSVECNNHPELVCKLCLEFMIVIAISYVTGFGYTGMVVLLLADIMRYTIDWQKRAMYILAVSVFSLMMNGNVLQRWMHVIPIDVVWSYYRADHVARLLGTLNIMNMINIYVFIFYMVILVLAQMSEKERILALNRICKRVGKACGDQREKPSCQRDPRHARPLADRDHHRDRGLHHADGHSA